MLGVGEQTKGGSALALVVLVVLEVFGKTIVAAKSCRAVVLCVGFALGQLLCVGSWWYWLARPQYASWLV